MDALSRHVGEQATKPTEAIFSFSDGDKLRDLLESAGLREATVHSYTKLAHFPSPEDFVAIQWRGSNWARSGVQIERDTLEVMQAEVSASLKPYINSAGLALPMKANLATARK